MGELTKTLSILAAVAVSGAAGGFVLGMKYQRRNPLRIPWVGIVELGVLGDIIAGSISGLAVMFVASTLLGLSFDQPTGTDRYIRMIALGILSGFAGMKLIEDLSASVTERVSKLEQDVEKGRAVQGLLEDGKFFREKRDFESAIECYQAALRFDPESVPAAIALAVTKTDLPGCDLNESIRLLDEIIAKHPTAAKAYYNRACFGALQNPEDKKQWLSDLQKAIGLENRYSKLARNDDDFAAFSQDTEFLRVTAHRFKT